MAEKHMFDKYFICDDFFSNVTKGGETVGFRLGVKVSYYRGVNLAVVDDFAVTVDGEIFDRDQITFFLRDREWTFEEMKGNTKDRWDFGEVAYLIVKKPGGLKEGKHQVRAREAIRIVNGMNIPPVMFVAEWEKEIALRDSWSMPPKIRRGVSFYSYQDEMYLGKMDVEDCIRHVTSMGADGIEIISEAMIPDFPNPSEEWMAKWHKMLRTYGAKPVCYDMFMDGQPIDGQDIEETEAVRIMETNIKLAARMGFHILRVVYTIPLAIIRKALPCAEKYDVVMGIELHPPFRLKTPQVDQYVEFIKETGTKHFGLIPDFGIFTEKVIPSCERKAIKLGADPENVAIISRCYNSRMSYEDTLKALEGRHVSQADLDWAKSAFGNTWCDPEYLKEYMPYTVHVHAKLFDMEDGRDPSVDNDTIFKILKESGYKGYVCTEYEGQRTFHDMDDEYPDNLEIIRQHHEMMKRLIGEE